jgi:hypothetical protein
MRSDQTGKPSAKRLRFQILSQEKRVYLMQAGQDAHRSQAGQSDFNRFDSKRFVL